jgi:hypothetical protein
MHLYSVAVRRLAAALAAALVLAVLAPMAPRAEPGPIRVRASEATHAVDGAHDFELPPDTTHIAIHWPGQPSAMVTAAFSTDGAVFSGPTGVEIDEVGASRDDGETYGSLMGAEGFRVVRVSADRPLAQVSVLALDAGGPDAMPLGLGAQAAAATTIPAVIPRSGWGADESLRFDGAGDEQWPREYFPLQKLVVHHTAGRNADPDPAATVRAIYYYHAVTEGWGDIGYHYLIDEAGRVYEGRYARDYWNGAVPTADDGAGLVVAGGHARLHNAGSMGIALLGTFDSQPPTPAAQASLVRVLAWASATHGIDPGGSGTYVNPQTGLSRNTPNIAGHRDYNATGCPGGLLYSLLPSIRSAVAAEMNTWPGETYNPARTLSFAPGTYVGRRFSATGTITASKSYTLASSSAAPTNQKSTIPNQGGNWYYITAGVWEGYWIPESSGTTLGSPSPAASGATTYNPAAALVFKAGSHTGYTFDGGGVVTGLKSYTLATDSGADTSTRASIANQPGSWFYITNGIWAGYWLPESSRLYLPSGGISAEVPFAPARTVTFAAGTYTGYTFDGAGVVTGLKTETLLRSSSASADRRAIINGRPYLGIVNGIWAGYWVPESSSTVLG